jgi:N6-L-threonylcarbamoyladenine synthase
MIAWAGADRFAMGVEDGLEISPLARWPLDPTAQAKPGDGGKA